MNTLEKAKETVRNVDAAREAGVTVNLNGYYGAKALIAAEKVIRLTKVIMDDGVIRFDSHELYAELQAAVNEFLKEHGESE